MDDTSYWRKQTFSEPLFPDIAWSRPERKNTAGKLLIVGGNVHGFSKPTEAYNHAIRSGIGVVRVLFPDATKKIIGKIFNHVEYAPSNPSGSFNQMALVEILDMSEWSDGVLLAGDFGKNAETAILIEKFVTKYSGLLTLTDDAVDFVFSSSDIIKNRKNTLFVVSFAQLQKLSSSLGVQQPFTSTMDLLPFTKNLSNFTNLYEIYVIVEHLDQIHISVNGQVVSTKLNEKMKNWQVQIASCSSVWWLQNPQKPLESMSASIVN